MGVLKDKRGGRVETAPSPGGSLSLGELLRESVRRDPSRLAIRTPEANLSYGELELRAGALASHLTAELGMARGARLGIVLTNRAEWTVAFFAAALAGVVPVPIDPRLGERERRDILADAEASAIVTTDALWEPLEDTRLPTLQAAVLVGDHRAGSACYDFSELTEPRDRKSTSGQAPVTADDVAAIFYTSGSTGRPKGVVLTHGNIICAAQNVQACLELSSSSIHLVVAPFSHVIGCNAQLVATILAGGRLDILPQFDAPAVLTWIAEQGVTVFVGVPAMYRLILDCLEEQRYDLSTLRYCAYGGSPCPTELIRTLRKTLPNARLINGYGLTETSSLATFLPDDLADHKPASLGRPCPGNTVRIVDATGGQSVSTGTVGEVLIRGPSVFAGYWSAQDQTEEVLRDGWLHTGDVGRIDEDGCLYVVDRIKDMIIRGGENVYCVEVEQVLQAHPSVAEAALVGVPDPVMGEEGKAFVVLKPGTEVDEHELRLLCRERLAHFKVPKYVVVRDEPLPRNATGKVMKMSLRR